MVITVDSPYQASGAPPSLKGASQDASEEACALLQDVVPIGGPLDAEGVVGEAPSETVIVPSFSTKLSNASPCKPRMLNRFVLSSYVLPQEWDCPSADVVAPGLEAAREIIDRWSPFNKRETSIAHMRDLYPTLLRVPVVALGEEYFIPFPGYLDRKSFLHVAEDGMFIHNHDFNESAKLVCFNF